LKIFARYVLSMIFAELICVAIFLSIAQHSGIPYVESKKILYQFAPSLLLNSQYEFSSRAAADNYVLISRLDSIVRTSSYYLLLSPIAAAVINFMYDIRARSRQRNGVTGVPQIGQSSLEDLQDRAHEPILSDKQTFEILAVCVLVIFAFGLCTSFGEGFVSSLFSVASVLWAIVFSFVMLTVISAIIFACAFLFSPKMPKKIRWRYTIALVPIFLPIALTIWGAHCAHMWHDGFQHPELQSSYAQGIFEVLFWAFVPVSGITIYLCRGFRIFCTGIVLSEFFIWLCFGFEAGCCVSNCWP
jgi:hypothetical protein